MLAPCYTQSWLLVYVHTCATWLVGSYHTSSTPSPGQELLCDFRSRSISSPSVSTVVKVTYASWSAPKEAGFHKIDPPDPTFSLLPLML